MGRAAVVLAALALIGCQGAYHNSWREAPRPQAERVAMDRALASAVTLGVALEVAGRAAKTALPTPAPHASEPEKPEAAPPRLAPEKAFAIARRGETPRCAQGDRACAFALGRGLRARELDQDTERLRYEIRTARRALAEAEERGDEYETRTQSERLDRLEAQRKRIEQQIATLEEKT